MQALFLREGKLEYLTEHPNPRPHEGQAMVRVLKAGICTTDLELVKGYAGFQGILGHEFVGVVEAAGNQVWVGRRVVGSINLGCNNCSVCLSDGPEHCPERSVLGIINHDGAFADYLTLPEANLVEVPDNVSDEVAVFTEPLSAALRIREQIKVKPSDKAAVVGPGRLGVLIGQVLALSGTEVTMLGRREASLTLPRSLGLSTGLVDEFPDDGFDMVVEATGNEAGFAHSLRLVRPLGTLVMKSTFAGTNTVDVNKLVVGELTVIGSRCGPFSPALRLLEAEKVEIRAMIEGEYLLSQGIQAFKHAAQPGVRKILLQP
jgi:threonine dehydrogenase-like Zn-dependent dehydrogenase